MLVNLYYMTMIYQALLGILLYFLLALYSNLSNIIFSVLQMNQHRDEARFPCIVSRAIAFSQSNT